MSEVISIHKVVRKWANREGRVTEFGIGARGPVSTTALDAYIEWASKNPDEAARLEGRTAA